MLRIFCTFVVVLLIGKVAIGQTQLRPNYKLLWKISGNGLKKPSYLFGTMHVQDNEAFEFSDSVLLKIAACEAFALEVHPDSVMKELLSTLMTGKIPENQLKRDLAEKDYQYLDSLLKARTGKSLQTFNSYMEVNMFLTEQFGKKDKETFLDSWLYNIARNQNKYILGLEQIKDQIGLLDSMFSGKYEELKKYLEHDYEAGREQYQRMLDLYYAGDIAKMEKFARDNSKGYYDAFIPKRNIVMANSIAASVQARTTFSAVGAAHLAGEEGIIRLLQKKGYQVTLVEPTFTGLAARYTSTTSIQKWNAYSEPEAGYSIDMPQTPVPIKFPKAPMTFQSTLDFGTMTIFLATHIAMPGTQQIKASEILDNMVKAISAQGTVRNSKTVKVGGYEGRDFEIENEGAGFRVQIILRDSFVYMLMVGSKDSTVSEENANRFFSSLKFIPVKQSQHTPKTFTQQAGAFSIDMPEGVVEQTNAPPDNPGYKIHVFYSVDAQTQETFIVRYNDFPPGMVSVDDSLYMDESLQLVMKNMKGSDLKNEATTILGFAGLRYQFIANEGKSIAMGYILMRGNRFYMMLALRPATNTADAANNFLNSLRFLPYQKTPAKLINFFEGVSLMVPEKFAEDSTVEKTNELKRYSYLDRNTGISFVLQVEPLSRHSQAKDGATYFKQIGENLFEEHESIFKEHPIQDQQVGHEYWVKSEKVNSTKRIRFLLADNNLISLWGFLPADYLQSNMPDEVFDSFTVKAAGTWSLFDDKTDLILKDIASPDSLTRTSARDEIREHPFELSDLHQIYKALSQAYPDEGEYYGGTRSRLLGTLTKYHDETTLPFIENNYHQFADTTQLRDKALEVLVSMKTENSVQAMVNLLKKDSARSFNDYMVLNQFYDSLTLLNPVVEQLLALEPRCDACYNLFDVVKTALDSSALHTDVKQKVIGSILTMAARLAEPLPGPEDDNYYDKQSKLVNLAGLLGALPFTQEVKTAITKLHQLHDHEIMLTTAIQLLKNNVQVPAKDLNAIAANPLFRLQLYRSLKEIGQEKLFNKKYLKPKMIAESELYEYISYEDGEPSQLQFVMEKKVKYNEAKQSVFIFKFKFDEDGEWYHGLSGPFPGKMSADVPSRELTTTFYDQFSSNAALEKELKKYVEENGGLWLK